MPSERSPDVKFEIGHVLFIDIVGYSKLLINEQSEQLQTLKEIVRATEQFRIAEAAGKLLRLPTGDGGALVFRNTPEAPVLCALEIARDLKKHPELQVRMGIHSGPVNEVTDLNEQANIAGAGINIAQRVMDCGDAGHILLSRRVTDDLKHYARWRPYLHEIGECKVKHGEIISLVNLYTEELGNPQRPQNIRGAAPPKSVAVLAFANLSDDKGSEYFSDGISEELLTVLQKIPGLHVAARTSAFSFKGKNATAQEIGQKLGVAHLVEGSVRKAGNIVRIAARLTRADTGEQVWSENYTRDLKDVFAVQSELAQTIVGQLSGQLTNGATDPGTKATIQAQVQAAEKGGTKNVKAHESYLLGRFYANRHSKKNAAEALVAYKRAVEIDPNFALAWAGLAETRAWECLHLGELNRITFEKHLADAREAAARALSLEPNLPEALGVRALIQLFFDFDWKGAAETLRNALALAPTNVALIMSAGYLALAEGDPGRATALFRQAVMLDPVNPAARSFLAQNLATYGPFAEAEAEFPRVVELNPATPGAHAGLGLAYLLQGKFEEAATEAQKDAAEYVRLVIVASARWSQKRIPESDAALARLKEGSADNAAYQIAEAHAYRGEKDQAFEWLERARQQRDPGLVSTKNDPLLVNLHEDPRWQSFLHTIGMADAK